MKLSELKPYKTAYITGCPAKNLPLKIIEMGCPDRVPVKLICKSPWGSPLYVQIGEMQLAIDKDLAKKIEVKTEKPAYEAV